MPMMMLLWSHPPRTCNVWMLRLNLSSSVAGRTRTVCPSAGVTWLSRVLQVFACQPQGSGWGEQGLLVPLSPAGLMQQVRSQSEIQILNTQREAGRNESNGWVSSTSVWLLGTVLHCVWLTTHITVTSTCDLIRKCWYWLKLKRQIPQQVTNGTIVY